MDSAAAAHGVDLRDSLVLLVAFLLTLFDAAATLAWVETGIAIEANPLINWMMEMTGTAAGLGLRVIIGGTLLLALRVLVPVTRLARPALHVSALVLGVVAVWHFQGFVALAFA
jgi:hypothetical protein